MRRRSATTALSPKLLKHFAAAAVTVTVLLAVFASGADWGVQAQVKAVEAKNQLASTEAEKFGTKRIGNTVRIANSVRMASFGDDGGGGGDLGDGGGGGGGSGGAGGVSLAPTAPRMATLPQPPAAAPLTAATVPGMPPPMPGNSPAPGKAMPTPAKYPSTEDVDRMTASSAQRSGAATADE